ncbi:hypothetical protein TSMEX_005812 [Taenia solium]|eukprot:TsM_000810100 transcript=TsM_000810100 gene=TsM_000810100
MRNPMQDYIGGFNDRALRLLLFATQCLGALTDEVPCSYEHITGIIKSSELETEGKRDVTTGI